MLSLGQQNLLSWGHLSLGKTRVRISQCFLQPSCLMFSLSIHPHPSSKSGSNTQEHKNKKHPDVFLISRMKRMQTCEPNLLEVLEVIVAHPSKFVLSSLPDKTGLRSIFAWKFLTQVWHCERGSPAVNSKVSVSFGFVSCTTVLAVWSNIALNQEEISSFITLKSSALWYTVFWKCAAKTNMSSWYSVMHNISMLNYSKHTAKKVWRVDIKVKAQYTDMKSRNKIEHEGFGLLNWHLDRRSSCREFIHYSCSLNLGPHINAVCHLPAKAPLVFRCAHLRPTDGNPGHHRRITCLRSPPRKHTVRFQFHPNTFDKTHNYLHSPWHTHTCPRKGDFQLWYLWMCILMVPWSLFVLREWGSCHHMSYERGIVLPNRFALPLRYFPTDPRFLSRDAVLGFDGLRHCASALNICKNIKLSKSWLTFHRPPVDMRFSHHCAPSRRSVVTSFERACQATMWDACKWSKAERHGVSGPAWLLRNNWLSRTRESANLPLPLSAVEHWDVLQAETTTRPAPYFMFNILAKSGFDIQETIIYKDMRARGPKQLRLSKASQSHLSLLGAGSLRKIK